MKKFISLIFVMLFLLTNIAFAAEEEALVLSEVVTGGLPKTRESDEVSLFSTNAAEIRAELEKRLLNAWENLDSKVDISDFQIPLSYFQNGALSDFYFDFLHHNPLCYYVDRKVRCSYYSSTGNIASIIVFYTQNDKDEIQETLVAIQNATNNILMTIDDDMTEFEKVIAVHDYMVLNYHYDNSYANHSIAIMLTKSGVCESYTLAFMHLMNELGIDCEYVSSKEMNHSWNLVKIDGEWYHIDLTWDDAQNQHKEDNFSVVKHDNALLSTQKIQSMESPHYGFDLNGLVADSTLYDDAAWHSDNGAIVHLDGMEYWVEGNTLVREDGKIIKQYLNGYDNVWHLPDGRLFKGRIYTGLVAYNELLYFNTETEIYTYNPKTEEIALFYSLPEITYGIYLDGNTLRYSKYCPKNCGCNHFIEGGSIKLSDFTTKITHNKEGKVVVRTLKETDEPFMIFSFNGKDYDMKKASGSGYHSVTFDAADEQTLFVWDENLRPLQPKKVIKK